MSLIDLLREWFRPQRPPPIPPLGRPRPDSALDAADISALLEIHNIARAEVGVTPLAWAPGVARFSQEWANTIASTGKVTHRTQAPYGENLAWGSGPSYGVAEAAASWYAEKNAYPPGTPVDFGNFGSWGHYSQMVWHATARIGAGMARIQKGRYKGWLVVVANYDPAGNMIGQKPY